MSVVNDSFSLNLIMLGNGQHKANIQSVFTEFAKQVVINSHQTVHLINGLGAASEIPGADPMVGTYDFHCTYDKQSGIIHSQKILREVIGSPLHLDPAIRAAGYHDAVSEAIEVIKAVVEAGSKPLTINMLGFGRAGDIWLRVSNILSQLYPKEEIKINIFTLDPVSDPSHRNAKKARFLPENVQEYESILMRDEKRSLLDVQDQSQIILKNPKRTHPIFHFYKGVHATAQVFSTKRKAINLSSRLVWDDIQKFADRNNIRLKKGYLPFVYKQKKSGLATYFKKKGNRFLSAKKRLLLYTQMSLLNLPEKPGRPREFLSHLEDYFFHGTSYFQDKSHMMLLKQLYPHFFDYFFQMNRGGSKKKWVLSDINKIQEDEYLTQQFRHFLSRDLPAPQGIPVTVEELELNFELNSLWEGILNASNYVLSEYDKSISTELVTQFKIYVKNVLMSDSTVNEKLHRLHHSIEKIISQCKQADDFALSLLNLISLTPKATILDKLIDDLMKLTHHHSWYIFSKPKGNRKTQRVIVYETVAILKLIQKLHSSKNADLIRDVLTLSLDTYNQLLMRDTNQSIVKNPMDNLLRQALMDIGHQSEVIALAKKDKAMLMTKLQEFKERLTALRMIK